MYLSGLRSFELRPNVVPHGRVALAVNAQWDDPETFRAAGSTAGTLDGTQWPHSEMPVRFINREKNEMGHLLQPS